ncbi:MAG: RNA-metabolising metallo-beta-lactamase [candidate division CPR2 bacterium GW2011_GWD2_39_7]|nr:MAG: RNA-metabolising metallo-beta-lactamase [candidate division CPR2 bacterium GW2011_GWD2_39_7]
MEEQLSKEQGREPQSIPQRSAVPQRPGNPGKRTQPRQQRPNDGQNLRIIPLGGMGEIGKNMYVLEYGNDILVIDAGFMFPEADMPGVDYVIPDVKYLEENKHKVKGYLITHAHEDHVGALPYVLPKVPAPIYAPKLTAALIQNKLKEFKIMGQLGIRTVDPDKDEKLQFGALQVEFIRMVHSIPDAVAIVIHTPVGTVIATGDFRFDFTPVDKKVPNIHRLVELSKEGVLALLSDSTGAESPGFSVTESALQKNFDNIWTSASGRIVVASFASQINRIQQFINATAYSGRKLAFSGRSLLNNVEVAVRLGYLKIPSGMIIKVQIK